MKALAAKIGLLSKRRCILQRWTPVLFLVVTFDFQSYYVQFGHMSCLIYIHLILHNVYLAGGVGCKLKPMAIHDFKPVAFTGQTVNAEAVNEKRKLSHVACGEGASHGKIGV